MSVYVDDMYTIPLGNFGRIKMSHMVADTRQELLEMADNVGVARKWIQHAGTNMEHFDVCMSARKKAVECGCIEIPMRKLARATKERKDNNSKLIL